MPPNDQDPVYFPDLISMLFLVQNAVINEDDMQQSVLVSDCSFSYRLVALHMHQLQEPNYHICCLNGSIL